MDIYVKMHVINIYTDRIPNTFRINPFLAYPVNVSGMSLIFYSFSMFSLFSISTI